MRKEMKMKAMEEYEKGKPNFKRRVADMVEQIKSSDRRAKFRSVNAVVQAKDRGA